VKERVMSDDLTDFDFDLDEEPEPEAATPAPGPPTPEEVADALGVDEVAHYGAERAAQASVCHLPAPGEEWPTELRDALTASGARELAVTTVLTVLTRLERKEFVTRDRGTRPHLYSPVSARADYMAELMHDVLGTAPDREAVLTRFLGQVGPSELELLKRVIADSE